MFCDYFSLLAFCIQVPDKVRFFELVELPLKYIAISKNVVGENDEC